MYVIMSNNGPWDFDMIGAVGAVETVEEFLPFVEKHAAETEGDPIAGSEMVVREGPHEVALVCDEHELTYLCDGEDVMVVLLQEPDCYPAIYVLSKFK